MALQIVRGESLDWYAVLVATLFFAVILFTPTIYGLVAGLIPDGAAERGLSAASRATHGVLDGAGVVLGLVWVLCLIVLAVAIVKLIWVSLPY